MSKEVISISDETNEKRNQSSSEIITTRHDPLASLRAKLAPAMLYVVSMAQFIDIGESLIPGSSLFGITHLAVMTNFFFVWM